MLETDIYMYTLPQWCWTVQILMNVLLELTIAMKMLPVQILMGVSRAHAMMAFLEMALTAMVQTTRYKCIDPFEHNLCL